MGNDTFRENCGGNTMRVKITCNCGDIIWLEVHGEIILQDGTAISDKILKNK
jgi:hypothetical protein